MKLGKHIVFLILFIPLALFAGIEDRSFETPEQEALYIQLTKELRCLVCQNQNLADSNAELAQDLRQKAYDMVIAGKTRDDITEFMIARYGDFVLYRPPVKKSTYVLWLGPFIFLLLALGGLIAFVRRKKPDTQVPVSSDELKSAQKHLND